ncbi:MAG: hypothetical protein HQK54_06240 [Oligoflexales bacterium]|nr:hypothetical protein [Oligoflexales bacterium]
MNQKNETLKTLISGKNTEAGITRRQFLYGIGAAGMVIAGGRLHGHAILKKANAASGAPADRRERIWNTIHHGNVDYVPGAFFLHFGGEFKKGEAAIRRHIEYVRFCDLDLAKVQYEKLFPSLDKIKKPCDWTKMPFYGADFFEEPLEVIKGVIRETGKERPVVATLYSPCMCAGHTVTDDLLTRHLNEDPEAVRRGFETIAESLKVYVREAVRLGVDGFLLCTQGGEQGRFADKGIFDRYVKPYDLSVMGEAVLRTRLNILHICDYLGDYDDLSSYLDYPGDVVNCSLKLGKTLLTPAGLYDFFGRPFMGGIDKKGVIYSGSEREIAAEVHSILQNAPARFILGASCTLPSDISWHNVAVAVKEAHGY